MRNYAAFTQLDPAPYPGYVSINSADDAVSITVRTRGNGGRESAILYLSREEAIKVFEDALKNLIAPVG